MYRCVAITPEGFIQQLAVCYVGRGYWFYVTGEVPEHKDPADIDRKLIERYQVDLSRWAKLRRKKAGLASIQYLRHGRFFVLVATHGQHLMFTTESSVLHDARRSPIRFAGYAISYRGGHPHVRIDHAAYLDFKAKLLDRATRAPIPELCAMFRCAPFEPYAPVRRQLIAVWRAVNRARKLAGLEPLPIECIRLRRKIMRPFGECSSSRVLLPAHHELVLAAVSPESDEVDARPQAAEGGVDDVSIDSGTCDLAGCHGKGAACKECQHAEVNRENRLAPAPTSDLPAAAGMLGLEGEETLPEEPVDVPLDLVDAELDVMLGTCVPES